MFHFNPNSKTALFLSKSVTKVLFFVSCMFGLNKQKGYCMQHFGIFGCLFAACSTRSLDGHMVLLPKRALPALSSYWLEGGTQGTWGGRLIAVFCGTE